MNLHHRYSAVDLFLTAVVLLLLFTHSVCAAEDWKAFYDALMGRGYYDVIVDYLESYRGDPDIPGDLKPELDRLLGSASLEQLRSSVTKAERDLYSEKAKGYLARYLKEYPDGEFAYSANGALADIYAEQGNNENARLEKGVSDAERETIQKTVRDYYTKAAEAFHIAVAQAKEAAQKMKSNDQKSRSPEAMELYADYLSLRIKEAELVMKAALTWPKDSPEWKKGLTDSRQIFSELYEKYNRFPGGFKALLLEAKASIALGDEEKAVEAIDELVNLPMSKSLYTIKTETLLLFGERAVEKGDPVDLFRLVDGFYDWKYANDLPPVFYVTSEGLKIHLLVGQAVLKLDELKKENKGLFSESAKKAYEEKKTTSMKLLSAPVKNAYEWFDFVYRQKNPLSLEAEKLLANPVFGDKQMNAETGAPATFQEAVERLNRGWTFFTQVNAASANAMTADALDTAAKKKKDAADAVDKAFRYAFQLAGRYSAEPGQLDRLRLQRAVFSFQMERWEDAEILADFLSNRRPGSPLAANAAEVALLAAKSALREAKKNGEDDEVLLASLETALASRAEYIIKKWGDSISGDSILPVVREALAVQMDMAVNSGDFERAKSFLDSIPEKSPAYADVSLQFGQSLWVNYIELLNRKKENPDSVSEDVLDQILADAERVFSSGLEKKLIMTNGGRGDDLATVNAALSLAQIELLLGRPDDAYKWLSHPNIGPLTLVERRFAQAAESSEPSEKDESVSEEAGADQGDSAAEEKSEENAPEPALEIPPSPLSDPFQLSALTLALRVLVAQNEFDHAEQVMSILERFVSLGGGNEERLTLVYLQLGKQLQDQIQTLRQKGDTAGLAAVSLGFEGFLDRISKRTEGNTYMTLRWVADTYSNFGEGLKPISREEQLEGGDATAASDDPELEKENAEKAAEYFKKAGRTYQTILKRIKDEPEWAATPNAEVITSLRLSESLCRLGLYGKGLKVLLPVTAAHETNLELQTFAASLLQGWGKKDRTRYVYAIQGAVPGKNGRNTIWGWNRIISLLARNIDKSQQYKTKFYEAVLNKMECRRAWAAGIPDASERAKQALSGEAELLKLHRLHPDLGGPAVYKKLEVYLRTFRGMAGTDAAAGFPDLSEESEVKEESAK